MIGPHQLTQIVYVIIAVVFLSVVGYMIYYTRQQKAKLRQATDNGARPQSVDAAVLAAKRQTELDERRDKR